VTASTWSSGDQSPARWTFQSKEDKARSIAEAQQLQTTRVSHLVDARTSPMLLMRPESMERADVGWIGRITQARVLSQVTATIGT
jgi:hypothetical protein